MIFLAYYLEFLFGTKLVVKGDKVDAEKDCPLIIVNHRCRLDWMFYWMVALRTGRLHHEKIIMKRELKFVPGPGKCNVQQINFTVSSFVHHLFQDEKKTS